MKCAVTITVTFRDGVLDPERAPEAVPGSVDKKADL
jgi:phosphoribosylformylglycinamidine (FGAM) synthase PurS component